MASAAVTIRVPSGLKASACAVVLGRRRCSRPVVGSIMDTVGLPVAIASWLAVGESTDAGLFATFEDDLAGGRGPGPDPDGVVGFFGGGREECAVGAERDREDRGGVSEFVDNGAGGGVDHQDAAVDIGGGEHRGSGAELQLVDDVIVGVAFQNILKDSAGGEDSVPIQLCKDSRVLDIGSLTRDPDVPLVQWIRVDTIAQQN